MNMTNKYLMFASVACMLVSCDLDKLPEGQYIGANKTKMLSNSVRIWL